MSRDSFERFYYKKVGLGEGCGWAEHVTRIRDLDALGGTRSAPSGLRVKNRPLAWLRRLARRIAGRRSPA